jgi:hypothetical protein
MLAADQEPNQLERNLDKVHVVSYCGELFGCCNPEYHDLQGADEIDN